MAKQNKRLPLYGAYIFRGDEKDPIIDKIHTMLEDEGLDYTKAAEASGVSRTTIYNWIEGETRKPQYCTIAAVYGAAGYEMSWVKKKGSNVVPMHRRKVA